MSTDESFKTCTKCGRELPREMFHRAPRTPSGLQSNCKDCKRAYDHARYVANREKILADNAIWRVANREKVLADSAAYCAAHREETRARSAAWAAAHPEAYRVYSHNRRARLRGAGGAHTAADVAAQYLRQHGRCFWCKAKLDEHHTDHVTPLALKGSNGKENLVIACPDCNLSKGAKHPMDFAGMLF